jgi:hypothetical protein
MLFKNKKEKDPSAKIGYLFCYVEAHFKTIININERFYGFGDLKRSILIRSILFQNIMFQVFLLFELRNCIYLIKKTTTIAKIVFLLFKLIDILLEM